MSAVRRMASSVASIRSARWAFDCASWSPTESDWLRAASGVQQDEKARIGRFVYRRDAKYSMVGRLLMRKFIVDSTDVEWKTVSIKRDDNNKPGYMDGDVKVQFNVSHQGNYAVFAGELCDHKIGIDVMKIEYAGGKSVSEFFRIMSRQFSEEEWSTIRSHTTEWDQLKHFYRFWCLKESYVKAEGVGITVNLKEVSFKLNSTLDDTSKLVYDTEFFLRGVKQDDWVFEEVMLDDEHMCAVALNQKRTLYDGAADRLTGFSFVTFNDLIKNLQPVTPLDVTYCREFLSKEESPVLGVR